MIDAPSIEREDDKKQTFKLTNKNANDLANMINQQVAKQR